MIRSTLLKGTGNRQDTLVTAAMVGAFLFAAAAGGVVIASGKPVLMALAVGSILGLVLVNTPGIAMWMVLVGVMAISSPLVFHFAPLERLPWLFAVLGFFLMMVALLHAGLTRRPASMRSPGFIQLLVLFMVYGALSMLWLDDAMPVGGAGLKRYFQFFGVAFALSTIDFKANTVRRWTMFFVVLAVSQVPYVLYQRFIIVPRMGWTLDGVNGTYEALMNGHGNSGSMAFTQVVILAGLVAAWWERVISARLAIVLSLMIVSTLLLAEVNVIFISLPLAIGLAMADQIRKRPMMVGTVLLTGTLVFAAGGTGYLMWQQEAGTGGRTFTLKEKVDIMIAYNFGDLGYAGDRDANRNTVYSLWWQQHSMKDPVKMLVGHGIGTTNRTDGQANILTMKFPQTNIALVTASQLLWELGVVGLLLFVSVIVAAMRSALRLTARAAPGLERTIARTLTASVGCSLLYLVYSDAMLIYPTQEVAFGFTLGLLAWMVQRRTSAATADPTATPADQSAPPGWPGAASRR